MKLLNYALKYYQKGLAVVPIGNGGKSPINKRWSIGRLGQNDLRHYFDNGHNVTGIGIITGQLSNNLVVLDFDGPDWEYAYEHFLHCWDELRSAPRVQTGSGKRHIWLTIPDLPIDYTNRKFNRNRQQIIELRGNASNNVAPPSLHPCGKHYCWRSIEAELIAVRFTDIYAWLNDWGEKEPEKPIVTNQLKLVTNRDYAPLPGRTLKFLAEGANEGERNTETYEAAKQYAASGRPLELAVDELLPVALLAGLSEREIEPTIKSGYKAATEKGFSPIAKPESEINIVPTDISDEVAILKARVSKQGKLFSFLWAGRWQEAGYKFLSEADLALCKILAFWVGNDPERVDRIYRQSAMAILQFKEWDKVCLSTGETYGQRTIFVACSSTKVTYASQRRYKDNWVSI